MRRDRKAMLALALAAGLLASGCAGRLCGLKLHSGDRPDFDQQPEALHLQYLGAGGFLIKRGEDTLLTAPFFSNPGVLRVAFGGLRPNPEAIETHLPREADQAAAILVGHAHYDHALDLPYIARHRSTQAVIYGNNTLVNILRADLPPGRLEAVEDCAGWFQPAGKPGEWIDLDEGRIRFMALRSEHAPHFLGIKLFGGEVRKPARRLPRTAWGWKDGVTLAYLIDFMAGDGRVDYRILYMDTAVNSPPFGGMPALGQEEERPPDLLILCMASFNQVKNYPQKLVRNTVPRRIVAGHWEDFFRPVGEELRVVRMTNGRKFMERLAQAAPKTPAVLPRPGAWLTIGKEGAETTGEK